MGVTVYVTPGVKEEVIEKPMGMKKFALEAYRIKTLFDAGILKVVEPDEQIVSELMDAANNIYSFKGKPFKIIHTGEGEALALVKQHNADALLMDERTTRLLIEDPHELKELLGHRTGKKLSLNENALEDFKKLMPQVPIIRSAEVAYVAYDRGLIDELVGEDRGHGLESLLAALKFSGCAINWGEIRQYGKVVGG